MVDFIQWLLLIVLSLTVGWLFSRRRGRELPSWIEDLHEEDIVTREELDRYHHHVIQMSHAQRDLFSARLEEFARRESLPQEQLQPERSEAEYPPSPFDEKPVEPPPIESTQVDSITDEQALTLPEEPRIDVPENVVAVGPSWVPKIENSEPDIDVSKQAVAVRPSWVPRIETSEPEIQVETSAPPLTNKSTGPGSRAVELWNEGWPIDRIATELRIGRQEADLLVRMAHRHPVPPPGA